VRQSGATIARADTPKGTEPHGRSRRIPTLRVLHRRATLWRAGGRRLSGARRVSRAASAVRLAHRPRVPRRALTASAVRDQRGSSQRQLRLRPGAPLRGRTASRASARDPVKLAASCPRAPRPSGRGAGSNRGFGRSPARREHPSLRAIRLRCRVGLAPPTATETRAPTFGCAAREPDAQSSGTSGQ